MRLRNVLSLITVLTLKSRDVDSVDQHEVLGVFLCSPCGVHHSIISCDLDEDDDDYYSVTDVHEPEDEWTNHYNDSLNWYISECDRDRWTSAFNNLIISVHVFNIFINF